MTTKLDKDIFENDKEYFFTFLSGRFEYATQLWKEALEKRFGKKFEPIFVDQEYFNHYFPHKNFISVDDGVEKLRSHSGCKELYFSREPDDINKAFSESKIVKDLIKKLLRKQRIVFILPFSSVNLSIDYKKVLILSADSKIALRYDNKIEQNRLFHKLTLSHVKVQVFNRWTDIKNQVKDLPILLSPEFSSGGNESRLIYEIEQIDELYNKMRDKNRKGRFIATKFLDNIILSPNSNAIIFGKNKTVVNCISDQILRGQRYVGNIYPSKISEKQRSMITAITEKVGNYLSRLGFRGIFGLDFIIDDKGKLYVVDLNPRRQGGYMCHILAVLPKNINLVELELGIYLGDKAQNIKYADFQTDFVWAHSKVKPYGSGYKIISNFRSGDQTEVFKKSNGLGKVYKSIFYPNGLILDCELAGYYMTSGRSYNAVLKKVKTETDRIIRLNLKPTSWNKYLDDPRTKDLMNTSF